MVYVSFSVLSGIGSSPTHDAGDLERSCYAVSPVTEVCLVAQVPVVPVLCMVRGLSSAGVLGPHFDSTSHTYVSVSRGIVVVIVVVVDGVVVVVVSACLCVHCVVDAREKRAADTGFASNFCRPDHCVG